MEDMDNFSEINQNFDTVKTLLNSIRAQGILNTSDVDKLLTGINSKLEKLNTEEDIDLIKMFLSELKQNLEERHTILVSKFGAIESLFSNLLKNSSEMPKSSDIKELFDIIATNLSVFSREVVSQKESITDIALKLDAFRSDDSQKKDIIKNIAILKSDLERLSNGFDSIVISLNDNFKTVVKTITTIDKTVYLENFSDSLNNIENSSKTVLSALQILDKKAEQVENVLDSLATKEDITTSNQRLFELKAQNHEITAIVNDLSDRYVRIDNLADKIDASVNIIASLKSVLEEVDDKQTHLILEQLKHLEAQLQIITTDTKFDEFKASLENLIKNLADTPAFQKVLSVIKELENEIKSSILDVSHKLAGLQDANVTRVLGDISTNAEMLGSRLSQAQTTISQLCDKNFIAIFDNIGELKNTLAQLDENNVSANNAIFSSISERLSIFENGLKSSLENQENAVNHASTKLVEQIDNIKNLSSVLDYKMDSSVVEVANIKREFASLQNAVEAVLALDFVSVVKDLRVDLYASKQELANSFDASSADLSDKITNDLYGKYELLISKMDAVEDEFKKAQADTLADLKSVLDKISSSIVDVLSYVSEANSANAEGFDGKLTKLADLIKENSLNYVDGVRSVIDVLRVQIDNNIKTLEEDNTKAVNSVKALVAESSEEIKKELKYAYSKLIEIQDSYSNLNESFTSVNAGTVDKIDNVIASANEVKEDIDKKLIILKNSLVDKITEFKQEFTIENADKVSELKYSVESLYNKNSQDLVSLVDELKLLFKDLHAEGNESRTEALSKLLENFEAVKDLMKSLKDESANELSQKVDLLLDDFTSLKTVLDKVDENLDGDLTRQLSIIESNFESLVSQISILFDKSDKTLVDKINGEFNLMSEKVQSVLSEKLDDYKTKIEETFENLSEKTFEQSKCMQDRIVDLNNALKGIIEDQAEENNKQIEVIATSFKDIIDENIKLTAVDYVSLKNKLVEFAKNIELNNQALTEGLKTQIDEITRYIDSVLELQNQDLEAKNQQLKEFISDSFNSVNEKADFVKSALEEQLEIARSSSADLTTLSQICANNNNLVEGLDSYTREQTSSIVQLLNTNKALLIELDNSLVEKSNLLKSVIAEVSNGQLESITSYIDKFKEYFDIEKEHVTSIKEAIVDVLNNELNITSKNIEKETDVIIAELIEQFELLKNTQSDNIVSLTSNIEEIVNAHIYNNIEDLKSYLDIRTDNSVLVNKFDNLKIEIVSTFESLTTNLNKMLDADIFKSELSDFRAANELLISTAVDKANSIIEGFISDNYKNIEEKFALFDKKFIDAVVDKYEEIKLDINKYNETFTSIQNTLVSTQTGFDDLKSFVNNKFDVISEIVDSEMKNFNKCFEDLRAQISNKSFDEAFQASINKQVADLETLVNDQMGYIMDINELCANNLPDIAELNVLLRHSILDSINQIHDKVDSDNVENLLNQLKTDIVTQILNVFNQISFVTEQEEILDFIQAKHDDLIEILSHIVTTSSDISTVKKTVISTDKNINTLKNEIELINNKINSIISSEDDVDYVYSLQDLETDIANLRLVLNEMKDNGNSQAFADLVASTNEIYNLVESIKQDLPNKSDFESVAEDIESISTRTNKLLLSSDESYKYLQDNLQDFKLVINDLDERTRNFAKDSGIDKIDSKLNSINSMVVNGAKSNQVFNQVFEYLAEWVDNAGTQINAISDKVETLDDIGQIKVMLSDLKAKSEDNSENAELIAALGDVFDKQVKKIAALETKLDKVIVETTIKNKDNKIDLSPIEATMNRFLVAMDEKLSSQQEKVNLLEEKLSNVLSILDEKDTAQLAKKVGGMDRQIAKLNKSIEKIASHVVEE